MVNFCIFLSVMCKQNSEILIIIEKMLENCDIELNVDYLKNKDKYNELADKILYTGMIDEYFDYCLGNLEYRSLKFENEILTTEVIYKIIHIRPSTVLFFISITSC